MRISVFLTQLKSVCTQRGMEFNEAVKIVADAGVKGVDVDQWAVPATIQELHHIFDTCNFLYCGEDAFDACKILKPYIKHQVHLKDRSFAGRESETPAIIDGEQVYSAAVGKGFLPIKEILTTLRLQALREALPPSFVVQKTV